MQERGMEYTMVQKEQEKQRDMAAKTSISLRRAKVWNSAEWT